MAAKRELLRAALFLVALYVLLDVILGLLPPHYSLLGTPESDYAVGPYGFVMDVNFLVRGASAVVLAIALAGERRSRTPSLGRLALVAWGVASAVLAVFPTDLNGGGVTTHGMVHLVFAGIAFVAAAVALTAFGPPARSRGFLSPPALSRALAWCAWLFLAVFFVSLGRGAGGLGALDGLCERLFLATVLAWTALAALSLLREVPPPAAPS